MNQVWHKFTTARRLLKENGPVFVARYAWFKLTYKSGAMTRSLDWDDNISIQDIFAHHYKNRHWMSGGNLESISGPGSTIEYTKSFRRELEELIRKYELKSLFDAPCGDFNWMKLVVDNFDIPYIGGDIVEKLISKNIKKFKTPNVDFVVFDITSDTFPKSDLWLCRDCLFHLSFQNIFRALKMFMASEIDYCLITTQLESGMNEDIKDGDFRKLNLLRSPFNLPQPRDLLRDFPDGQEERYVGLWRRSDLRVAAKSWPDLAAIIHERRMI